MIKSSLIGETKTEISITETVIEIRKIKTKTISTVKLELKSKSALPYLIEIEINNHLENWNVTDWFHKEVQQLSIPREDLCGSVAQYIFNVSWTLKFKDLWLGT